MPKKLSSAQVQSYERNGFLSPVPAFSPAEAADYRGKLAAFESAAVAGWHQDATYFGLRPHVHVTAWLALTDATAENGCMEFLPRSHHRGQRPHRAGVVAASVNRAGQAIVGA